MVKSVTVIGLTCKSNHIAMYIAMWLAFSSGSSFAEVPADLQRRIDQAEVLKVHFEIDEVLTPPARYTGSNAQYTVDGRAITIDAGPRCRNGSFTYSNGNAHYELKVNRDSDPTPGSSIGTTLAFTSDRVEHLLEDANSSQLRGAVAHRNSTRLPPDAWVDVALGLRPYGADSWLSDVLESARVGQQSDSVELEWTQFAGNASQIHSWQFDAARGFALRDYKVVRDGRTYVELHTEEYFQHDADWFPRRTQFRLWRWEGDVPEPSTEGTILISSASTGDRGTPADLRMRWPAGTIVVDGRTAENRNVVVREDSQPLEDSAFGPPSIPIAARASTRWWWILATNALVVAALLFWYLRQRGRQIRK